MSGLRTRHVWPEGWTYPARVSGIRLGGQTSSWIGPTGLTGVRDFSTLLEFGFLTSLMETILVLSTLVLSRSPCCIPLCSTMTYTQERSKTSTCPSPSHPVPRHQGPCLLFSDVWFIIAKSLLILLQLPS
jgi:hypothetical protein